ncbi:MAG: A24 family peptidase [Lautropia sp.]|nr:A24 family peptidase [Lautropia sp.]
MGIDTQYWVTPELSLILAAILGLLIGSFLNVVIHRLPLMMQAQWEAELEEMQAERAAAQAESAAAAANGQPSPVSGTVSPAGNTSAARAGQDQQAADTTERPPFNLMVPRSRCPSCGHEITALENIPVLSWLFLRGKCSGCKTPISCRYPAVELITGALTLACAWQFGVGITGLAAAVFCWVLISLTLIDYDTQLLPDSMTLPLLWGGLLLNLTQDGFVPLREAVIGAMAGYLSLWSIYWVFKLVTGKEGMGYGDFKLLAAIGAWFGWMTLPAVILMSSVIGALVGISLILFKGHGREQPIPFGPYLAGGGLVILFFRDEALRLLGA